MLNMIQKDLTTIDKGIICHGVNNAKNGVMGAGVALALRQKYPQIFDNYSKLCRGSDDERKALLGRVDFVVINPNLIIANCFSQTLGDIYPPARPDAIDKSLSLVFKLASECNFSVYLPKIGAGLGGLDWNKDVEPIVKNLSTLYSTVDTYICVYP